MDCFWGIDLGGTKIEGVVLSSEANKLTTPLARRRIDTEAELGYDQILLNIASLVAQLSQETGLTPTAIGVGHPGTIDPATDLIKNSNTQCLNSKPLKLDLSEKLNLPIHCANDANCFALAEAKLGAGKGAAVVFGIIMGTGVGGGVVVNGSLLQGAQGIAGEWGHNVLIPFGAPCYCGKNGCVEGVFSGPALELYYQSLLGHNKTGSQKRENHKTMREISTLADSGDILAQQTINRLTYWFGKAVAVVVNILDPDVVVLGGGVSNVKSLYTAGYQQLAKDIFNDSVKTKIVQNALGDSAGVFGAAMLAGR
jgi:fructokinase